jgi:hypothetical protein
MKRYPIVQPIDPRPTGTGAFWDYACASAKRQDSVEATRPRSSPSVRLARIATEREQAEQRWDSEGGKSGSEPDFRSRS